MNTLTYESLVDPLVKTVPEFPADKEDVRDNLPYLVFPDLMRFVNSQLEAGDNRSLLRTIFSFIERAAETRDQEILEVLRDSLHDLAVAHPDEARAYMGRRTRELLKEVEGDIY